MRAPGHGGGPSAAALALALAACAFAAGCAADLKRANLRELQMRAAFDLGCAPAGLALYPFDERSKGVAGCGRRLSYVEICDHAVGSCTWMIDGMLPAAVAAEKPVAPAVGAPPPGAGPAPPHRPDARKS